VGKPFRGTINVDIRDSVPDWEPFEPPKAPDGAPSVLYIVLDDVGFAAIGYCAGIGATARRAGAFVALALGCGLASAWIAWSPWRWWVPQSSLPDLPVTADAGTRYALLPAFQPLSTLPGRWGSGLDPDAKILPSDVDAINMLVPSYPVDAALSAFEQSGDARRLAELGVSEAIVQSQGNDRIVVQIPGIQDPERARQIIKDQAFLEFRITDKTQALERYLPRVDQIIRDKGLATTTTAAAPAAKQPAASKGLQGLLTGTDTGKSTAAKKDSTQSLRSFDSRSANAARKADLPTPGLPSVPL